MPIQGWIIVGLLSFIVVLGMFFAVYDLLTNYYQHWQNGTFSWKKIEK